MPQTNRILKIIGKPIQKIRRVIGEPADTRHLSLGPRCELAAKKYLQRQGMIFIEGNVHDRNGEIDLIMVEDRTLVFVEVKARRSDEGGAGIDAVDSVKQTKICRTALAYLRRNDLLEQAYRFDVVSILWNEAEATPKIEHYADAFPPPGRNQLFG